MPRTCTICRHRERDTIDRLLIESVPLRNIAEQFAGISITALHRHKAHLPASLVQAREAEEVARADSLLAQVEALRDRTLSILAKAERANDLRTALQAVREASRLIELLAQLTGELVHRAEVRQEPQIVVVWDWEEVTD